MAAAAISPQYLKRCLFEESPVVAPFTKDVYSVEELLGNPQSFTHTMVTVGGCYVDNFEISVLVSCDRPAGPIWVESAKFAKEINKLRRELPHQGKPGELMTIGKQGLLFTYDERRDSRAWHKLSEGNGETMTTTTIGHIAASKVVLLGQFETSELPGGEFGHLSSYSNELILLDVLNIEASTNRPKSR